jgi:hypothetical protein
VPKYKTNYIKIYEDIFNRNAPLQSFCKFHTKESDKALNGKYRSLNSILDLHSM